MIDLDIKRNEKGYYILDDEALKSFKVSQVINQYSNEPEDDFKIDNGEFEIFVKVAEDNGYMMSLYGELLFSKFAEMNGIPCAEIDVGIYEGKPVLLSKSVKTKDTELLPYSELERLLGVEFQKHTMLEISNAVKKNIDIISERLGEKVRIHPNFENNLKALCAIDYRTGQADRHAGNMMFELVDEGGYKVLNIAPMFDNEAVFAFMEVKSLYHDNPKYFDSIFNGQDKDVQKFREFFEENAKEEVKEVMPQFGMVTSSDFYEHEVLKENVRLYGDGRYAGFINKSQCLDIVNEMIRSQKFSEFCANLQLNAKDLAVLINMETEGFEIPPQFLDLAQKQFDEKKQQLNLVMKKMSGKAMGE